MLSREKEGGWVCGLLERVNGKQKRSRGYAHLFLPMYAGANIEGRPSDFLRPLLGCAVVAPKQKGLPEGRPFC